MTKIERRKEAIKPIPPFTTIEEEAEWFDTHDMADYQDEFKTVKARFAKKLSEGLNIQLDEETLATIRAKAQEKGIGPTTLAQLPQFGLGIPAFDGQDRQTRDKDGLRRVVLPRFWASWARSTSSHLGFSTLHFWHFCHGW